MDVRQLRYFISIAECGSLSKAADQLRIAQPSLSQHVLNLEAELGVQLLNRSFRGVTATEAGERLVAHAKAVLAQLEHIKRDIRETADGLTGNVVLGMPEKYSAVLTVPVVERVERQFPRINLRFVESMSGTLMDWLLERKVDIAILIEVQRDPDLVIEPLVSESLYLVGAPENRLSACEVVRFRDLADLPLILPSQEHGLRILAERTALAENLQLTVKSEIDSIPAIKSLLRISGGYTLLSEVACRRERKAGDLWAARIVEPQITQTGALAYRRGDELPKPTTHIRQLVLEVIRERITSGAWPGASLPDGDCAPA